jgi:hypothetical protein
MLGVTMYSLADTLAQSLVCGADPDGLVEEFAAQVHNMDPAMRRRVGQVLQQMTARVVEYDLQARGDI